MKLLVTNMHAAFLRSLQTHLILFYLTVICNLATCSFNATKQQQQNDESHLVYGCKCSYPNYVNQYTNLVKIDKISCQNMLVSELPSYENVTKIELTNVPLSILNDTEIPKAIQSERVDLRQLRWSKSHIKIVESVSIGSLIELDISWNSINDIRSRAFKRLTALKNLNISYNDVETLPETLFDVHNSLRILSISHNQLKSLPPNLYDNLRQLEILDISNNHLQHIQENVFQYNSKLMNLNLSHNKISLLSGKIFHSLPSLQYLSLEDNQLFHLEPDTFANQRELIVLNLGKNPLWSLPNTLMPDNNTLYTLTISDTKLNKIKSSTLQNLQSLRNLYLTDNRNLGNFHNDTFTNLRNLKVIHLQNNNFTQLPYSITDTSPDDLYLDGNRWPCDCTAQWIVFWAYSLNNRKTSLRLTAYCNDTNKDLLESLYKMHCKPTIINVSPVSYQSLEAKVKLICKVYAYPKTAVSWVTPNGLVYTESDDDSDPLRFHPAFKNHRHLPHAKDNVNLDENGDLDIKQMSRDDAGEYICIATNKMGEAFAYTRLYIDPSIMQRIKTGSIICGLLWVNAFLLFSIVYLLIRRYSRRAKQEKRTQRMHENMDVYKSQQISRLRERCKNQMNRIKNNCSIQVEWMKENYRQSMNNSQDHRVSYLTNQYNEQMAEIREYYLTQMHKVREHYDQQRNLILEFSINRVGMNDSKSLRATGDTAVRIENGTATAHVAIEEEDVYRYNDCMKNEIQKLTSLRNLHNAFVEKQSRMAGPGVAGTSGERASDLSPDTISNGKLKAPAEDEIDNEKTSMLHKFNAVC